MGKFQLKTNAEKKNLTNDGNSISLEGRKTSKFTKVRNMDGQGNSNGEPSDADLVAQYKETQDTRILQILLDRYDRYVVSIALPYLKDRDEVQDLKQDLFIKLWEKLQTHEPDSFRFWLGRVVRNHVYDKYLRKKRPETMEELPEQVEHFVSKHDLDIDFKLILSCLENLRPDQRLYVELAFLGGMKNAEIVEETGWSPNKTRGLYDRALKNLRQNLGGSFDEFSSYFTDV